MFLKPKSTANNPRALLYRRFTALEDSFSKKVAYKTADNKLWLFDAQKNAFTQTEDVDADATVVNVANAAGNVGTFLYYNKTVWAYANNKWNIYTADIPTLGTLLNAAYANVAKYQLNKYYFVGSFDFMVKGSVSGSTVQYIKGLITPQTSFNIRTFNDHLEVRPDDLVVVDKRLYSVENPEVAYKRMPKKFGVYFMTLNNIL